MAKKGSIKTDIDTKNKLEQLKGGLTYGEAIEYLLKLDNLKIPVKGATKAELQLLKWLNFGHDRKITATELRSWTSVNLNHCKEVIELYKEDVKLFNIEKIKV